MYWLMYSLAVVVYAESLRFSWAISFFKLILQLISVCHLQNTPVPRFASFSGFRLLQLDCQKTQIQNLPSLRRHSLLQRNKPLLSPSTDPSNPSLFFFSCLLPLRFFGFFNDFIPLWKDSKLELVLLLV